MLWPPLKISPPSALSEQHPRTPASPGPCNPFSGAGTPLSYFWSCRGSLCTGGKPQLLSLAFFSPAHSHPHFLPLPHLLTMLPHTPLPVSLPCLGGLLWLLEADSLPLRSLPVSTVAPWQQELRLTNAYGPKSNTARGRHTCRLHIYGVNKHS